MARAALPHNSPTQQDSQPRSQLRSPPKHSDQTGHFLTIHPYRDELELELAQTLRTRRVAEFPKSRQKIIETWLTSSKSEVLLVYDEWHTMLTLKTVGYVDFLIGETQPAVARIAHLCGANASAKGGRPRILVLDLLSQVLSHHEQFNKPWYSRQDLSNMEDSNIDNLWEMLRSSIEQAGIEALFIFLDNVHILRSECVGNGREAKAEFNRLVGNIKSLTLVPDLVVKVMVTCMDPDAKELFSEV